MWLLFVSFIMFPKTESYHLYVGCPPNQRIEKLQLNRRPPFRVQIIHPFTLANRSIALPYSFIITSMEGPLPSMEGPLPSMEGPLPSMEGPLPSMEGPLPSMGLMREPFQKHPNVVDNFMLTFPDNLSCVFTTVAVV